MHQIKHSSIPIFKKLINLVATSQPFTPNIERISSQLHVSKEYIYNYLDYLEQAKIFSFLFPQEQGFKLIRKPEKIYLENPNLIYTITGKSGFRFEMGAVRESFFLNQVRTHHVVNSGPEEDFIVDKQYFFEIGDKNKTKKQIYKRQDAFIVTDDTEGGTKNKIPLWLFGFLY